MNLYFHMFENNIFSILFQSLNTSARRELSEARMQELFPCIDPSHMLACVGGIVLKNLLPWRW